MEFKHQSVLLSETIEGLKIIPDGIYVDGTLGGAGHSYEIASRLSDKGLLIGIDQDEAAIAFSTKKLMLFEGRVRLIRNNYAAFSDILKELEVTSVDGILLDLGVSSHQLDTGERGFSYMQEGPLDMRMDQRGAKTAADIVNHYSEEALTDVIKTYGEERFAKAIARNILKHRAERPFTTTTELVEVIRQSIPTRFQIEGGHPAKRTFQSLRIELNSELKVLKDTINVMIDSLKDGGRFCIITFHSLEDRIVKELFHQNENPCICPKDFPICTCGRKPKGIVITRKPILPGEEELSVNSRSKSAKLRIFERRGGV